MDFRLLAVIAGLYMCLLTADAYWYLAVDQGIRSLAVPLLFEGLVVAFVGGMAALGRYSPSEAYSAVHSDPNEHETLEHAKAKSSLTDDGVVVILGLSLIIASLVALYLG